MITRLQLRNFQSHKDSTLVLGPGVTVLVGSSDSGKTSVLRGLRWVVQNRPRGTGMIRKGTEEAKVAVETGTGDRIIRSRTKSKNRYELNGEPLEAMGSDVPEPVQEALPLGPLNLASQLEPHFLVLLSPGQIAGVINDALHLEDAKAVADRLASRVRQTRGEISRTEEVVEAAESRFSAYSGLDTYREGVDRLEGLQTAAEATRRELEGLDDLLDGIDATDKLLTAASVPQDAAEAVSDAEAALEALRAVETELGALRGVMGQLEQLDQAEAALPPTPDLTALETDLQNTIARITGITTELDALRDDVEYLGEIENDLARVETVRDRARQSYTELRTELRICPVCDSLLT